MASRSNRPTVPAVPVRLSDQGDPGELFSSRSRLTPDDWGRSSAVRIASPSGGHLAPRALANDREPSTVGG
jgi:hypothetical protein